MKQFASLVATVILLFVIPSSSGSQMFQSIQSYGTIKVGGMDLEPLGIVLNTWTVLNPTFENHCKLAKELGIFWARTVIRWDVAEPENGTFNWELVDYKINCILNFSGTDELLVMFTNVPSWASGVEGSWTDPPIHPADFKEFVIEAVNRYKDRVKYWEIYNEPNLAVYWKGTPEQYLTLLENAYEEIKKADPNATVLSAGISNADFGWVKRMYELGWKPYFDILSIHPYSEYGPLVEGSERWYYPNVAKVLDVMAEYGDSGKDVWITEIAWNTAENAPHFKATEEEQALYLTQAFDKANNEWSEVKKFFWYVIQDYLSDSPGEYGENYYGLIRLDGTKKPSWYAYTKLVERYVQP